MSETVKRIFTVTIDEFTACGTPVDEDAIWNALSAASTFCDVDKIEVVERRFHWRNRDSHPVLAKDI